MIPYILSAISLFGCFLNINKDPACWPVWILSAVGFGIYLTKKKEYGAASIWWIYILFDAYGWWRWTQ